MNEQDFQRLIDAYLANRISATDADELFNYIKLHPSEANRLLIASGNKAFGNTETAPLSDKVSERMLQRLLNEIHDQTPVVPLRSHSRRWRAAVAVAAAVVLAVSVSILARYSNNRSPAQKRPVTSAAIAKTQVTEDVLPGTSRAILTLANGARIVLDTAATGLLATEGSTKIINSNGGLKYDEPDTGRMALKYNTISTQLGEQYPLTLSDGTRLWLNAGSSIRFPVAFIDDERRVEISGEVYFEVARNESKPFIVKKVNDNAEIAVLGTHFNVNAYDDEASMKVTLLEGSVKVSKGANNRLMIPGQQAQFDKNGGFKIIQNADTDEAIAWKNGFFKFSNTDVKTVMRQIARWYNIEVAYGQNSITDKFSGVVSRNNNISEVLKILELGDLHFEIQGKRVTVLE